MADPSWDMAKDMAKHPHSWHGLSHNNSLSQAPCTPYHAMPRHATKAVMVCKDLQSSLRSQFLSQFLSFSVPNTWSGCFNRNTPGSDSRGVSPHVSGSMIKSAPILPSIIWKNLKSSKSLNYTRCDMHNTRDLHLTKWNTVQYSTIQYGNWHIDDRQTCGRSMAVLASARCVIISVCQPVKTQFNLGSHSWMLEDAGLDAGRPLLMFTNVHNTSRCDTLTSLAFLAFQVAGSKFHWTIHSTCLGLTSPARQGSGHLRDEKQLVVLVILWAL